MSVMCLCLCLPTDEGVYVNSNGGRIKDVRLQWGEVPSSIGGSLVHTCIPASKCVCV